MSSKDDDATDANIVRYPVMPSLVALQLMRNRCHLAQTGKKLMTWTSLATGKELRKLSKELAEIYVTFREDMSNCFMLLARARYFCPSMNETVVNNLEGEACITIEKVWKSITGVKVIKLIPIDSGRDSYPYLGIGLGGIAINEAKKAWRELLKSLIVMATTRVEFLELEDAHRNATKRQNIITKVVIPKLNMTIKYILSELEEKEREDTFRLKRFKELKMKKAGKNTCKGDSKCTCKKNIGPKDSCNICTKNKRKRQSVSRSPSKHSRRSDKDDDNDKGSRKGGYSSGNDDDKGDDNVKMMKDLLSHIDDIIDLTKQFEKKTANAGKSGGSQVKNASSCDICQEILKANEIKNPSGVQSLEMLSKAETTLKDDINESCNAKKSSSKEILPLCESCRENVLSKKLSPSETKSCVSNNDICDSCKVGMAKTMGDEQSCVTAKQPPQPEKKPSKPTPCSEVALNRTGSKSSTNSKSSKTPTKTVTIEKTTKTPCYDQGPGIDGTDIGSFEKKFKEIVRVIRVKNDDGSVSEERRVITIRTERQTPKVPVTRKESKYHKNCTKTDSEASVASQKDKGIQCCATPTPSIKSAVSASSPPTKSVHMATSPVCSLSDASVKKPKSSLVTSVSACNSCSSLASNASRKVSGQNVTLVSEQTCGCQSVHVIPKSKCSWFEDIIKDEKPVKLAISDSMKNVKSIVLIPMSSVKSDEKCAPSPKSSISSMKNTPSAKNSSACCQTDPTERRPKKHDCLNLDNSNQTKSVNSCLSNGSRKSSNSVKFRQDASTNTRRSAKFDVRGVSSTPMKPKNNASKEICYCKSDSHLLPKKRPLWMSK